jgi:ATP-dependent protease ClpP protease subunit
VTKPPREARLTFSATVTGVSLEDLIEAVEGQASRGVECVRLAISTDGGEVASSMRAYEELRSITRERGVDLVTENTSEVASMGNAIYLAGDRRLAYPDAKFFLHPITIITNRGRFDIAGLREERRKWERSGYPPDILHELDMGIIRLTCEETALRAVFEQRTKLTGSQVRSLVHEHRELDASEARAMGIVHEIIQAQAE